MIVILHKFVWFSQDEKVLLSFPPILYLSPFLKFAKGTFVPIQTLTHLTIRQLSLFLFVLTLFFEMIDQWRFTCGRGRAEKKLGKDGS